MSSGFIELHSGGDTSLGIKKGQPVFVAIDKILSFTAYQLTSGKESGTKLFMSDGSRICVTDTVVGIQEKVGDALASAVVLVPRVTDAKIPK